jgi:hypothetical protein
VNVPPGRDREESPPDRRITSRAMAAAADAAYRKIKRGTLVQSAILAGAVGAVLGARIPWYGLVWLTGTGCGLLNAVWSWYMNERLLERMRVGPFVISSFARLGLFGIVPVALALRVPSAWTLGLYFAGFFLPLSLYAVAAWRTKIET